MRLVGGWALVIATLGCSGRAAPPPPAPAPSPPVADAAPPAPDARVWGHVTLEHLLAIGDPRPAFETEVAIIGHYVDDAARLAGAPSHVQQRCRGDFGSMSPCSEDTVYEFAITGLGDGHPIALSPSLRLGDRAGDDTYDFVEGFTLTLPATDVAVDAVMAGLRAKYGRPDHHSHDGLGVIWTRERVTQAVMSADGVDVDVSRPEDAYAPLERDERDATGNAACDRYIAAFDAQLACVAIPLADRLASTASWQATEPLWQALHFHEIVGDGLDHSHDGDGWVADPKDVAAATRGCQKARAPIVRALARAGCRAP